MQKIDLHENLINSFKDKLDEFAHPTADIKDNLAVLQWRMYGIKNSWWLEDYKIADLQVIGAVVWPFEKIADPASPGKFRISYSEKALNENLDAYEAFRKQYNIKLIAEGRDLSDTKYMDFGLNFFYKLVGADGIKSTEDVDKIYKKGIRIIQFVDQNSNGLCSSYQDKEGWLTQLGKDIIIYMESKKMIVDVANMNPQSMIETYRFAKRPLLNSHTNIMSLYNDSRNITDEYLDRIDPSDGLIGLSLNSDMIVGPNAYATLDQFMDQIEYVKNRIGADQVALGSCYHSFLHPKMVQGLETVDTLKLLEEKMTERFWEKFTQRFFRENAYKFLTLYL